MGKRAVLLAALALCCVLAATEDYKYFRKQYFYYKDIGPLVYHVVKIERNSNLVPVIQAVPDPKTETLSGIIKDTGSVIGLNGGFFGTENNEILGIMTAFGRIISNKKVMGRGSFTIDRSGHPGVEFISNQDIGAGRALFYKYILSGGNIILKNGQNSGGKGELHPMTAIGISSDSYFLFAAEGRSLLSFGINEYAIGEILRSLGCTEAVAMDGGGSTELAVNEDGRVKIMNKVAGGSERPIKTAILFRRMEKAGIALPVSVTDMKNCLVLSEKFEGKGYALSVIPSGNGNICIEIGDKVRNMTFSGSEKQVDDIVIDNSREKSPFPVKILCSGFPIDKVPAGKNTVFRVNNGFDRFSLLERSEKEYLVRAALEDILACDETLLFFLIYRTLDDIIQE